MLLVLAWTKTKEGDLHVVDSHMHKLDLAISEVLMIEVGLDVGDRLARSILQVVVRRKWRMLLVLAWIKTKEGDLHVVDLHMHKLDLAISEVLMIEVGLDDEDRLARSILQVVVRRKWRFVGLSKMYF
nr:hypothetical protein [Tanacetum cinerariifolium]